nr:MAG: hypothetical protein [Crogonang virus 31]
MRHMFCSRCWNYVDACDCINYSYDLEVEPSRSIPAPPEEQPPEVGTVWYFRAPIRDTSLLFESNGIDRLGLALTLTEESLWTLEPPPGDPSDYLSIPVDRLPLNSPFDFAPGQSYDQYQMPWDFNFFNYDGPSFADVKSLAEALMSCNSKRLGRRICKLKELGKHFAGSFKVEDVPIPPGMADEILGLSGVITPEMLLLIIQHYIPDALLKEFNNSTKTAIDYEWIHQHLVDGTDPPDGYDDKKQPYRECLKEGDYFCEFGSYPFPKPSQSVGSGDRNLPPLQQWQTNIVPIRPTPMNPIVVPWEEEENDPPVPSIPSPIPPLATELAYPIIPLVGRQVNPVAYQLLNMQNNQSTNPANVENARLHHLFQPNGTIETHLHTGLNTNLVDVIVPTPNVGTSSSVGALVQCGIVFSWIGDVVNDPFDPVIIVQNNLDVQTLTADPVTRKVGYGWSSSARMALTPHIMYHNLRMRGGDPTIESIWRMDREDPGGNKTFGGIKNVLTIAKDLKMSPPFRDFNAKGFATNDSMLNNVIYSTLPMTLADQFQLPMSWFMRRVAFMKSYPENAKVTIGTQCFSRAIENTGDDSGTLVIPYWPGQSNNATGLAVRTYDFSLSRVPGEAMLMQGLHTVV